MLSKATTSGRVGLSLFTLLVLLLLSPALLHAQGRVSNYIVEQFPSGGLTWDWSKPYTYLGWSDNATYNTTLPFKFSFDGIDASAGSTMRVSTNGWVQLTLPGFSPNAGTTVYNLLNSSTYRGTI